ncbi:unnamed protein product [Blepharisma stoltei]|uniref:Uncharacterized protein n=1 Tax=Blepharisma stoltei TaxID=1481888 RepID=A0AAU9KIH1_9CILI|nr:unnamed protein product [Blepharisma stoltei]
MRGLILCCFTGKKPSKLHQCKVMSTRDLSEYAQPAGNQNSGKETPQKEPRRNSVELDLDNRKRKLNSPEVERRKRKSRTVSSCDAYHPLANYVFPRTKTK